MTTAILLLLLAVGYLLIIFMTMFKRGSQGRMARFLILYALLSIFWELLQLFTYNGWLDFLNERVSRWIPHLGILLFSVLFFALSKVFLSLRGRGYAWVTLGVAWFVTVLATIFAFVTQPEVLARGAGWEFHQDTMILGVIILGWALLMGRTASLTLNAYQTVKQPLHKNRIFYWVLALVLMVCGDLLVFIGLILAGSALRLFGILFAAYVLLFYELVDVLHTGFRSLLYLVTAFLTIVAYIVVFAVADSILKDRNVTDPLVFGIVLAVALVLLVNPLVRWISKGISKMAFGAGYDTSRAVREYSLQISNVVDLELLATVALEMFHKTLAIRKGYLFLVDEIKEEGKVYFRLRSVKYLEDKPENQENEQKTQQQEAGMMDGEKKEEDRIIAGRLGAESPIALYFTQTHRPLRQYDLDFLPVFQQVPPEEREWLAGLEADVCVPVYDKSGWTGLFALGPKISGYPYSNEDVTLLSTLADQTAVALENSRHFTEVQKVNDDLSRTYKALEKANEQLRELDELKSAFIGVITHEMRTPFANLAFNLQILEMYGKDHLLPEQRDQLVQLSKGIKTARMMVDNLITVAGFFSRKIALQPESLDFKEILRVIQPPLKEMADEKEILFHVNVIGELLPVKGDRRLLSDAIYQLVHNAIKFTKEKGKVWVSCWTTNEGLFFDVKDTGVGVPADKLSDLWQSFTQAADPLRRGLEGLGLGLALVKNIITAHEGEVWVESTVGKGSVFGFRIPLGIPPDARPASDVSDVR
jgi:signal transduction histidine kinase